MNWLASSSANVPESGRGAETATLPKLDCFLTVMGVGLVTPAGADVKESVFLYETGTFDVPPSPYQQVPKAPYLASSDEELGEEPDDLRVDVRCCPWLGHRYSLRDRLCSMALTAARDALLVRTPQGQRPFQGRVHLMTVVSPARRDLGPDEQNQLQAYLRQELGPVDSSLSTGDAATFDCLRRAEALLSQGGVDAVLLVAVDSFISLSAAAARVQFPGSPWAPLLPPLGEGAAALLLTHPHRAREFGSQLADITGAGILEGKARHDNEEVIDGLPLTWLLSQVRSRGSHVAAYGPNASSTLGRREWDLALARNRRVLLDDSPVICLEERLGLLGAAATTVSLVFAIGAHYWGAVTFDGVAEGALAPILVWGLGEDSRRGVITANLHKIPPEQAAQEFSSSGAAPKLQPLRERPQWGAFPPIAAPSAPDLSAWVRFDEERGHAIDKSSHEAEVVPSLLEESTLVARHLMTRHLAEAADEERQFFRLQDAVASFGKASRKYLDTWWQESIEGDDPYRSFVLAYTCASWSEPDALDLFVQKMALLPEDARRDAHCAGRALSLTPQPHIASYLAQWAGHSHPVVAGAALAGLSHLGQLQPEYFSSVLAQGVPTVIADVLLYHAAYLPSQTVTPWISLIERWMRSPDPRLSWYAARAATLQGSDNPLWALRQEAQGNDFPLARRWGPDAVQLLVWTGAAEDGNLLPRWVQSQRMSPEWLKQLALFGHSQIFTFLLRFLGDEDLSDGAASALEILFGPVVDPLEREEPASWIEAVERLKLDPTKRYRLGKLWNPACLAEEIQYGQLSWLDTDTRLAEFQRRLGAPLLVENQGWASQWLPKLQQLAVGLTLDEAYHGAWVQKR